MTSGRKQMPEANRRIRVVQLYLTKREWDAAKKAADGRPLASWLRNHAFNSAGLIGTAEP